MGETSSTLRSQEVRSVPSHASSVRRLGALAIVGTGALLLRAPAAASPAGFPPLVSPPSTLHVGGKFVFAELVTPHIERAEAFYGALLGWTFRSIPVEGTRYAEAMSGGGDVASLVERPLPPGSPHRPDWLPFISAPDPDRAASVATDNGGKVLFSPRDVPGLGREAVLADPYGGVFAVLHSSSGDPADVEAADGEWIWSSLITPDPQADGDFYRTLFGYDVYPVPGSTSGQHLVTPTPRGAPAGARARWVRYVRVDDAGAIAEKAERLGGRVLVQPHPDRDGGTVAILGDPDGAVFGVLEHADEPAPAKAAQ